MPDEKWVLRLILQVILFIILLGIEKRISGRCHKVSTRFIYSGSALKYISKKNILIIVGIVTLTAFMVAGCDVYPMLNSMRIQKCGFDIYQFQAAVEIKTMSNISYGHMVLL